MFTKLKHLVNLQAYKFFFILFLVSLVIYVAGIIRVKSIVWGDSLYYYSYTRSLVQDKDIDFKNQAYHPDLGFPNQVEISSKTGRVTNKFSPGTALFWIPAFILGQCVSYLGNIVIGHEYFLTDGTGILSQYFIAVSSVGFSVLGLWFLFKTLEIWFTQKITYLTIIILFLTTQIFYYTAVDPVNSHSISFLLSSILLFQLSRVLKTSITWKKVIPMGVVAGFLVLVRNQDAVVVLPVLLALLLTQKESFINKLNWITLYLGSVFIIFSVQIYTTIILYGVLASPYVIKGEEFSWFKPNIFRVLFTQGNGLFFFSPILLLALIFITKEIIRIIKLNLPKTISKHQSDTKLFKTVNNKVKQFKQFLLQLQNPKFILLSTVLISFLLQLYVVASWGKEIIGGPYGTRMFVSVLPHLSLGIALFIESIQSKLLKKSSLIVFIVMILVLFINSLMQTLQMLFFF